VQWSVLLTGIMLQPIEVRTGCEDREGRLVLVEGVLAAVLVRLDDPIHDTDRGRWFLEAGLGSLFGVSPLPFADLDEAQAWLRGHLLP
jgi:hypothetical protein